MRMTGNRSPHRQILPALIELYLATPAVQNIGGQGGVRETGPAA